MGRGSVRFMMLFRKADAPLDFDFQKVTEQSKDNPVFYVQYRMRVLRPCGGRLARRCPTWRFRRKRSREPTSNF